MKYAENVTEVGLMLPDYMGFIFWKKSLRFFDGIIPEIPHSIKKTGVFVDAPIEEIRFKIHKYKLDLVQLHGNETPDLCVRLSNEGIKIIKVFSINNTFNFDDLQPFKGVCDYFLFDTKGKSPGGNGTKFDWEILQKYKSTKPFFLSGGIGIEDIDSIKKLDLPIHAIDLNSKFETAPGLKDPLLLQQFQTKLR